MRRRGRAGESGREFTCEMVRSALQPSYLITHTVTLHIRLSVLGMFSAPYVFPLEFNQPNGVLMIR